MSFKIFFLHKAFLVLSESHWGECERGLSIVHAAHNPFFLSFKNEAGQRADEQLGLENSTRLSGVWLHLSTRTSKAVVIGKVCGNSENSNEF